VKRKQADHAAVAAACRAQPGQWQEVGEYNGRQSADHVTNMIRTAYVDPRANRRNPSPFAPAGAFEARWELTEFGARVEARFVGEPITDLETAVREYGAIPVPAGPAPDRLTHTFAAVQTLRTGGDCW